MRINQEMIDFHQQNIGELYEKASGAEMIPQTATSWHRQLLKEKSSCKMNRKPSS